MSLPSYSHPVSDFNQLSSLIGLYSQGALEERKGGSWVERGRSGLPELALPPSFVQRVDVPPALALRGVEG